MITDYAKNIYRIEERMRDSESRAAEASKQVSVVGGLQSSPENEGKEPISCVTHLYCVSIPIIFLLNFTVS